MLVLVVHFPYNKIKKLRKHKKYEKVVFKMMKHSTLTQLKKDLKIEIMEDDYELRNVTFKIEVSEEMEDGKEILDFNLNVYSNSTDTYLTGETLETYTIEEKEKAYKRMNKLSEKYEIVGNIDFLEMNENEEIENKLKIAKVEFPKNLDEVLEVSETLNLTENEWQTLLDLTIEKLRK